MIFLKKNTTNHHLPCCFSDGLVTRETCLNGAPLTYNYLCTPTLIAGRNTEYFLIQRRKMVTIAESAHISDPGD